MFWRKKTNGTAQEIAEKEDRIIHHPSDPGIEPSTDYEPEMNAVLAHELNETEAEVIEDMVQGSDAVALFDETPAVTDVADTDKNEEGGWLSRLSSGLTKSSAKVGQGLTELVTHKKLDPATLSALEEILIAADVGPATSRKIVARLADQTVDRAVTSDEVRLMLAEEVAKILEAVARPLIVKRHENGPFVMLVCGVNGVGKTTTIGKIAKIMHDQKHHSVMLVAGDTFRAAAVEQLQVWGTRAHCPVITRDIGADAAALGYEAYDQARRDGSEVMMMDTAGRLHNKSNLMAELEKIVRVLKKHGSDLPHEVLLVLDGTTGQNAIAQVETFKDMVNVTGLIVTKLDGSAKGGVVVALADRFGLPIYAVGVGEGIDDLQPFTPEGYARALVGLV